MIDNEKTNLLRKKIQQEKTELTSADNKNPGSSSLAFLLLVLARYFAFYGTQWLILTKFSHVPFTMLETIVIYFGIVGLLANKK